jgi:TIR domain/PDZ domain
MAHDVFVSYSTDDKTIADAVCTTLEANGIQCWIAPRDIIPGMDWGEAIVDAIHTSRVMILVFSSNANDSQQVRREVERAANRGLIIMPLRIEDVTPTKSLAYFIGPVHWLDALTPPLERHLQNLAEAVRLLLSRKSKDQSTIENKNSPAMITEEKGRQVSMQEQRLTEMQAQPARGRFKQMVIGLMVVCSLGLGLAFYGLWPRVDQGPVREDAQPQKKAPDITAYKAQEIAEKAEQRGGEAACYDEAAVNSLVVSLQKTTELHKSGLINILDLNSRQAELIDDLHYLMARGSSTEACIFQKLELVKSLHDKNFIHDFQWNASRQILLARGWVGMVFVRDVMDRPHGVLVEKVSPNNPNPLAAAGIQPGDIVVEWDGKSIERSWDLLPLLGNFKAGDRIPVKVIRDGKEHLFNVEVSGLPLRKP